MGGVGAWVSPASCSHGITAIMWSVVQAHTKWWAETSEITHKNHLFFSDLSRFVLARSGHICQLVRLSPDCKMVLLPPKFTVGDSVQNLMWLFSHLYTGGKGHSTFGFWYHSILPPLQVILLKELLTESSNIVLDNICYGWQHIKGLQEKNFQENYKE